MGKTITMSAVSGSDTAREDLSPLAGRWNSVVHVTLTRATQVKPGPVRAFDHQPDGHLHPPPGHVHRGDLPGVREE